MFVHSNMKVNVVQIDMQLQDEEHNEQCEPHACCSCWQQAVHPRFGDGYAQKSWKERGETHVLSCFCAELEVVHRSSRAAHNVVLATVDRRLLVEVVWVVRAQLARSSSVAFGALE